MRITELSIKNYRALKDVTIPMSHFGCLIGENNSGKSSFLQALSLFFSGSKVAAGHFFDDCDSIRIAVTFDGIGDADLARLAEEHRTRVAEIVSDGRLVLVRAYGVDGKSVLNYSALTPTDARFAAENIAALLKAQRVGQAFANKVVEELPVWELLHNLVRERLTDSLRLQQSGNVLGCETSIRRCERAVVQDTLAVDTIGPHKNETTVADDFGNTGAVFFSESCKVRISDAVKGHRNPNRIAVVEEMAGGHFGAREEQRQGLELSLIHISEPTRRTPISYAVFCL